MTDRQKSLFDYHENAEEALKVLKNNGFDFLDTEFIWQILIYELEYFDIPTKVVHHNLSSQDIVNHVKKHFGGLDITLSTITVNPSIVPDELNDRFTDELIKAEIKMKGEIWIIHLNDKDPFPSSPHAHNYQRNCKLHLGNGGLYRKTNFIRKIKSKDLKIIREKITEKTNIILPPYEL